MDFTAMLTPLASTLGVVVAALTAVAAIKILPNVTRWGFGQVIGWFRGSAMERDELAKIIKNKDRKAWADYKDRWDKERAERAADEREYRQYHKKRRQREELAEQQRRYKERYECEREGRRRCREREA